MRVGLGIPPIGLPMDLCFELVQQAEARGFDYISVGEAWGTETCTMAGALLARTHRIQVGTGIVSIYLRPPTLAAMQAMTLDLIAPGRTCFGLGVSTQNINGFHGIPWDYPVSRTREYVSILRQILAGERVTYEGKFYRPRGFQLSVPPPSGRVPIYLAAVNPQMLQLAGEVADGVLLAWLPARQLSLNCRNRQRCRTCRPVSVRDRHWLLHSYGGYEQSPTDPQTAPPGARRVLSGQYVYPRVPAFWLRRHP